MLPRLKAGQATRPLLFTGIRGIGKTALLAVARREAEAAGLPVVRFEATKRSALLDVLTVQLERVLGGLSSRRQATRKAFRDLAEFKIAMKLAGSGVEIQSRRSAPTAMSTEGLFRSLLGSTIVAAAENDTPLVIVIDEIRQGPADLIGPLLISVHEAHQDEIPMGLIAAGLPNANRWVAQHVTYAGRMFELYEVGLLNNTQAGEVYSETIALIPGQSINTAALNELVARGEGLPYFLQEFGSALWLAADNNPINLDDVHKAVPHAQAAIGEFYAQRWQEASHKEQQYLIAMASLGAGPQRSADIAAAMGEPSSSVGSYRQRLIQRGLIIEIARGSVQLSLMGFRDWLQHTQDLTANKSAHTSQRGPHGKPNPRTRDR